MKRGEIKRYRGKECDKDGKGDPKKKRKKGEK